jgi:hypothetical protein
MQIQTILNPVQKFKLFVYGTARYIDSEKVPTILVELKTRTNSHPICSIYRCKRAGYDTLPSDASSLFRCGVIKCFSFIPHVELTVRAVVFG